jgi:asparagine synthase (glutamine-hydrolysing)
MCPIGGVFSRNGEDVATQIDCVMASLYPKNPAKARLVFKGMSREGENGTYEVPRSSAVGQALGQVSFITREQYPEQPALDCSGRLAVLYEGNLYNIDELRSKIDPVHRIFARGAADIIAHLLEENYRGDLRTALRRVTGMLDGAYCLAAGDGSETVVMRDCVGRRPIFYGTGSGFTAFASKKKALWEAGLRDAKRLRAGTQACFEKGGITVEESSSLGRTEISMDDLPAVVDSYCSLLKGAVAKRLHKLERVGVLVSGGVDSCLIAKLVLDIAAQRGIEVTAYTAGMDGAPDIGYAERFARELGMSHEVRRLSPDEVESYIPQVASAVEERDLVQIEAGIGVYAAVEMASQEGIKVIFSGQGADELWGGYSWYPQVVAREGYQGLRLRMWRDLERTDIETLDRENRIAIAQAVELVFPYLDTKVVRLAMSVSPRLMISSGEDSLGKRPHREAAKRFGLPMQYAERCKDAAQHGSGIHDTLDTIARENGFTPGLVAHAGYDSAEVTRERLGSSTRYGYLYDERELWQVSEHVQFFLDSVAYENNLLNEAERSKIERFLEKARS